MRLIKILLLLQLVISLNSCGPLAYKKVDSSKISNDPDERVRKNIEEGKSFKLFDSEKGFGRTTTYEFASSNELWRATLDTIDFMPLTTANYSGGIIVTDWYSDNQNLNENIKITIRFLTNEIRSDALDLKIFYRNCDSSNKCKIIEKEGNLSKELKKEILKKAVIYQQQAKVKKDKKD
ncbi:DUF3576 domain-containing protein [Candidatus Pelagibacter sp.]|nr:DUF3576 domain-containing protein [Candidatus Pelagibacter sp.]